MDGRDVNIKLSLPINDTGDRLLSGVALLDVDEINSSIELPLTKIVVGVEDEPVVSVETGKEDGPMYAENLCEARASEEVLDKRCRDFDVDMTGTERLTPLVRLFTEPVEVFVSCGSEDTVLLVTDVV